MTADSQASTPPTLVAFDWGGVIMRHCRSWAEGCEAAGLPHYPELHTPEQVSRRKQLHASFQCGACEPDDFVSQLCRLADDRYTPQDIRLLHDRWLLTEYADVGGIVDDLHAANVDTALLSNTNHLHWIRHLETSEGGTADFPTARKLKHRYASHIMGLAKPDPAIFVAFESATGFTGPQILFFDDLPDNCAAADALGWRTVLVDHTQETAPQIRRALRTHRVL